MINLHAVVRGIITSIHADEPMTLFHSIGQKNVRGKITPVYSAGEAVLGQPQSDNDEALVHERGINSNEIRQKFYLYSDVHQPTAGIVRIYARNGDIIQRSDGSYWLVTGVLDDFHRAGWVCVRATLQVVAPDFSIGVGRFRPSPSQLPPNGREFAPPERGRGYAHDEEYIEQVKESEG